MAEAGCCDCPRCTRSSNGTVFCFRRMSNSPAYKEAILAASDTATAVASRERQFVIRNEMTDHFIN